MAEPTTTSSIQPPQSLPHPPPESQIKPSELLWTGISQNSIPKVRQSLDEYAHSRRGLDVSILKRALGTAVREAKPDIVRYLLDETDVKSEALNFQSVGLASREAAAEEVEEVLDILIEKGWDINAVDGDGYSLDGHHPIYGVCHSERLVRWFLSHGAHVSFPGPDVRGNPPLLEVVARQGTVNTFKLLQAHGAPVGLRCLHSAVESAAFASRDNESEKEAQRMEMVRFLVEEIRYGVNGMDVPEGLMPGNHYGTPLNYAAHTSGGEEVVRYLISKDADPRIKDCYGAGDAFTYAKGNRRVTELLAKWKEEKEKEST